MLISPLSADEERLPRVPGIEGAPRESNGRFTNYAEVSRAGLTVTLPFFFRRSLTAFRSDDGAPASHPQPEERLAELLADDRDFAFWIGHATLLLRQDGVLFLTDPVWSRVAGPGGVLGSSRFTKPAIPIDALPEIEFILLSHNHYDHLDMGSLKKLAKRFPELRIFAPLGHRKTLDSLDVDLVELDWGEQLAYLGLRIACLPARHWSRRGLLDMRRSLWSSWAVLGTESRFYFGGDTGFFPELEQLGRALGPFDLAALPIGAYEPTEMMRPYHLNPEEALDAALLLGARNVLGIHYGTFDLTDEPLAEPPERFLAAGPEAGFESEQLWVLEIGDGRTF